MFPQPPSNQRVEDPEEVPFAVSVVELPGQTEVVVAATDETDNDDAGIQVKVVPEAGKEVVRVTTDALLAPPIEVFPNHVLAEVKLLLL